MKNKMKELIEKINWNSVIECVAIVTSMYVMSKYNKKPVHKVTFDPAILKKATMSYADALKAVIDSDMLSTHKSEAIRILRNSMPNEYYIAVVEIVKSDEFFSNRKLQLIKDISK